MMSQLESDTDPARKKGSTKRTFEQNSVSVFCRIRPADIACGSNYLNVLSSTHIEIVSPNAQNKRMQCMFSEIFNEQSQKDVFDKTTLPLIEKLLSGQNSLLFTYGVSGGGKTYTMTGGSSNIGIVPRTLDVIFNSIGHTLAAELTFKPDQMNNFVIQCQKGKHDIPTHLHEKMFKKRSFSREHDETKIANINTRRIYAVFVSFVEVYNNNVYDLLENVNREEPQPKTPQNKVIRCDTNHNMYVHGATEIEVRNSEEAFLTYNEGNKRRKMAHTLLNIESSRSHSVFSIRVVQVPLDEKGEPDNQFLTVSQLSLVDLAGSERTVRTKHSGIRLKEAGQINNSLMTLRSCLEILRNNQQCGDTRMIPYRNSKITLLFKNFFEGEGQVNVIVCINPYSEDYEETLNVMRFAAVSQEVVTPSFKRCRIDEYEAKYSLAENVSSGTDNSNSEEMFNLKLSVFPNLTAELGSINLQNLEQCIMERNKFRCQQIKEQKKFRKKIVLLERESTLLKQAKDSCIYEMDIEHRKQASLQNQADHLNELVYEQTISLEGLHATERKLRNDLKEKDMQIRQCILDQEKTENVWKKSITSMTQEMTRQMESKLEENRKEYSRKIKDIDFQLTCLQETLARKGHTVTGAGGTCTDVVPVIHVTKPSPSTKSIPIHSQYVPSKGVGTQRSPLASPGTVKQ